MPIYTAGSLSPQGWVVGKAVKSELELGLLWTATTRSFINTNLNGGLGALIQLKAVSGGKFCTLNFSGALIDEVAYFGEKDGAELVKVKLGAIYNANPGGSLYTNVLLQNGIVALI
jgi:hypothetical protein